jgi:hypothetical protein
MVTHGMEVPLSPSGSLASPRSPAFSASLYPASPEFRVGPGRVRHQSSSLFVSPLELTLTRRVYSYPDLHEIKPLESIASLPSPLELTLTRKVRNCPNLQQITPLESVENLLSPLELTLTKNAHVSPLESALTKSDSFKSHRIILVQK